MQQMIKINELLKTIKAHRKEAEYINSSNLVKQELDKGILDRTKKIQVEKTRYLQVSFSEVVKGDYLPVIIKKRKELEELAEKFLEEEQENVLSSYGEHSLSHEEYYFDLAYTLFYTQLENDEELLSRVKRDILKDYVKLYEIIDPIELFENIVIDQDNCFSILHENFEYKFQITSDKLKEKILNTSDNQKLFDVIRSSAQNITSFSLTKLV